MTLCNIFHYLVCLRPLIASTGVANCIVKEMTTEWIIYIILIVAALTVSSGLCNLFYYTCYGHPWEVFLLDLLCFTYSSALAMTYKIDVLSCFFAS